MFFLIYETVTNVYNIDTTDLQPLNHLNDRLTVLQYTGNHSTKVILFSVSNNITYNE